VCTCCNAHVTRALNPLFCLFGPSRLLVHVCLSHSFSSKTRLPLGKPRSFWNPNFPAPMRRSWKLVCCATRRHRCVATSSLPPPPLRGCLTDCLTDRLDGVSRLQKGRAALDVYDALASFSYLRPSLRPDVTVSEWLSSRDVDTGDAPAALEAGDAAGEATVSEDGEWSV